MQNTGRIYRIQPVNSTQELAGRLVAKDLPLCRGFYCSGFLYLNTRGFENLTFVILTLSVQVQDMAGHFSLPAAFPVLLTPTGQQEPPPPGDFQEDNLGPIMIRLRTIQNDLGSPFDRGIFFREPFR